MYVHMKTLCYNAEGGGNDSEHSGSLGSPATFRAFYLFLNNLSSIQPFFFFFYLTCKTEIKGLREVLKRLKLINFTHASEFLGYNLYCPVLS